MAEQERTIHWPGWEVTKLIGRGSFGEVYEIQRHIFERQEKAALKVISVPQHSSDIDDLLNDGFDKQSITRRFESVLQDIVKEYSLMSDMKGHTNIVYCDDLRYIQHDDGMGWDIYIKMELLTPLPRFLGSEYSEAMVIKAARDLCNALVLCRQKHILHRDIKPQNIFVSDDGNFKLGDFGIAKTVDKTTSGTKTGTYKYMPPEIYHDQPYGSASDIYSLGLTLYWMMNERRTPFLPLPPKTPTVNEETEARRLRLSGKAIPAPKHGSPALQSIVLKACAFDPKNRYASAEEMLRDLDALKSGSFPLPVQKGDGEDTFCQEDKTILDAAPRKKKGKWLLPLLGGILAASLGIALLPGAKEEPAETQPQIIIVDTETTLPVPVTAPPETTEETLPAQPWKENLLTTSDLAFTADTSMLHLVDNLSHISRRQIYAVTFLDTLADAPEDSQDVSLRGDGRVLAWTKSLQSGMYHLYIAAEGGINGQAGAANLFCSCMNLQEVNFNNAFFTDDTTDMSSMFYGCERLSQLDVSSLRTGSAKSMDLMFYNCKLLKELDVSAWDTGAVTTLASMFNSCSSLTTLDLSSWDVSKVLYTEGMFWNCPKLETLNLSGWDTGAFLRTSGMFAKCKNLKNLDLSGWNTGSVTDMSSMFKDCGQLEGLNLGAWDTAQGTNCASFMDWGVTYDGAPWEELFYE